MKSSSNRSGRKQKSELELLRTAFYHLNKKPDVFVACQVPLLGRCVDLVYITKGKLISVEFKIHDWRKALLQAKDHKLGSDYAYVCMPSRTITDKLRSSMKNTRIGLYFLCEQGDWPFKEVIKASKSQDTWSFAREDMYNYVVNNNKGVAWQK
jgi:hypothetical protein